MPATRLHQLAELGQAMWLDYITRSLITSGQLKAYVDMGVRGLTSNPAIFEKAIAGGAGGYDDDVRAGMARGRTAEEIFEAVAVKDIQMAADVLRRVYDDTGGDDGYVSLEVSPHLAHDTGGTCDEARRFFDLVDRPNLMVKVPATAGGYPAIATLISEGYNINVTLMFSLDQYEAVTEAYLSGLETRLAQGKPIDGIASVASFFVSRVDVKVDRILDVVPAPEARALKGKIGIANAKMAYRRFGEVFDGDRWRRLADRGARVQRVLWGSTSTKNPDYADTLYPDNLIGPHTVNTVPPRTLEAFLDHGTADLTLARGLDEAEARLRHLAALGIDLDTVTLELLAEGIDKFARPFDSLMGTIATKKSQLRRRG